MSGHDVTTPGTKPHGTAVLVAQGISAGYGNLDRLHDVTVRLQPGIHVLLGPNGAGKTTLFRVLAGVLPPQAGRVTLNGNDVHRDTGVRRRLGVVGHRPALAPRLTVVENLAYWARILDLPRDEHEDRVAGVLADLGLEAIARQPASRLSRGQTQRVALAKATLADPAVLLLDEPLAGLDPGASARMLEGLSTLGASGRIVLLSAHELAEIAEIADQVAVLADGRLRGYGPLDQLHEEFVGAAGRFKLRGGPELAAAVQAQGYTVLQRGDASVEIPSPGAQGVQQLVAKLVASGVGVAEAGPLGNPLSEIYRAIDGEGTHR